MNEEILKLLADLAEGYLQFEDLNSSFKEKLIEEGLVSNCELTKKALDFIEPYRVKKAFIMAAGFGSRMREVTQFKPKPLVEVKGKRMIDTLIDCFLSKGIEDITIIRGYKKECFDVLLEKYPFLKFIDNDDFDKGNNITSFIRVADQFKNCYLSEADFFVSNHKIIRKYQFETNYLGFYCKSTDDWCFDKVNGFAKNYRRGGENTYQAIGISYWDEKQAKVLVEDIKNEFYTKNNWDVLWEEIPLCLYNDHYEIRIKEINPSDIIEIDSLDELIAMDESYRKFKVM